MFPTPLIDKLAAAHRVVVLTGAGVSAESGIPTFRDAQTGIWSQYDPEQLATPQAFRQDPKLVWEWYAWRRELIRGAQPNPGHFALAEWPNLFPSFTLITQNVDGFHHLAGNKEVVELHGNLQRIKCVGEGHVITGWQDLTGQPPSCPQCGTLLRPDVVWFGETLPTMALMTAVEASRTADVFFAVGTSALVQPAASLAVEAVEHGALLVEINLQATALTSWADFAFHAPSGTILPPLTRELASRHHPS